MTTYDFYISSLLVPEIHKKITRNCFSENTTGLQSFITPQSQKSLWKRQHHLWLPWKLYGKICEKWSAQRLLKTLCYGYSRFLETLFWLHQRLYNRLIKRDRATPVLFGKIIIIKKHAHWSWFNTAFEISLELWYKKIKKPRLVP